MSSCLTTLTLLQNTKRTQCPHLLHWTQLIIIKETLLRTSSGGNELQTQHKSVSVSDSSDSVTSGILAGVLFGLEVPEVLGCGADQSSIGTDVF